jgi:hypothetical protein
LFEPPLAPGSIFAPGGLSASDFALGDFDKGRDGMGLPGHLRNLWLRQVRTAVIDLAWTIKELPEAQIDAAKESGKVFSHVIVLQPGRRVTMRNVKIERFTRYLNERRKIYLSFQHMTLLPQ